MDQIQIPVGLDWRLMVAILALIVSILSIFFQYYQPSRIKVLIGEPLGFFYGRNDKLVIRAPITFFNEGARNLAVTKIEGRLTEVNSLRTMSFFWSCFSESKNVGVAGEELRPHYEFAGYCHTIIVPSRDAVFNIIQFNTWDAFSMTPGFYRLSFVVRVGIKAKIAAISEKIVEISHHDSEYLDSECRINEKRITKQSLAKYSEERKRGAREG